MEQSLRVRRHSPDASTRTFASLIYKGGKSSSASDGTDPMLKALARDFSPTMTTADKAGMIFDGIGKDKLNLRGLRCVVLGRALTQDENTDHGQDLSFNPYYRYIIHFSLKSNTHGRLYYQLAEKRAATSSLCALGCSIFFSTNKSFSARASLSSNSIPLSSSSIAAQ